MSTRPLLDASQDGGEAAAGTHYAEMSGVSWLKLLRPSFRSNWVARETICYLFNADDEETRDQLTRQWRDHKIRELKFVGMVGALLAGCLASAGSWPDVLSENRDQPWGVRAAWHSGLIFALFAVMVACQQSLRLHRLSAHRDGLRYIRHSLVSRKRADFWSEPSQLQLYAWEVSMLFLEGSIVCAIAGLMALVWLAALFEEQAYVLVQHDKLKMAITLTAVLGLSTFMFVLSQAGMTAVTRD